MCVCVCSSCGCSRRCYQQTTGANRTRAENKITTTSNLLLLAKCVVCSRTSGRALGPGTGGCCGYGVGVSHGHGTLPTLDRQYVESQEDVINIIISLPTCSYTVTIIFFLFRLSGSGKKILILECWSNKQKEVWPGALSARCYYEAAESDCCPLTNKP